MYPNIAAYETLNQNSTVYKSLAGQLHAFHKISFDEGFENVNIRLAAMIAYLDVAKELVFSREKITSYGDSLYKQWKSKNPNVFLQAKKYALTTSKHVIHWMNQDNYKETRTMPEYNILSDDPSKWEPTPPAYMEAIEPHWNKIRAFALDSASQFKPIPPPQFSMDKRSLFYKELIDVYTVNMGIRQKGDASEEIAIAQFWDCNPYVSINKGHFMFAAKKITPGAHWIGICKIACKQIQSSFEGIYSVFELIYIILTFIFLEKIQLKSLKVKSVKGNLI
ncbi:MAG: hypothetical protein GKR88_06475 [Flavobacteriaceae bacterium]|nr:MAG: hypothetical protein GKR88_06475 [Flavobacteriaceae bacterium]